VLVVAALAGAAGLIYQTQAAPAPMKVARAPKSAVILDQEQVRYDGGTSARTQLGYTVWQSFTAGKTGTLVQIDMASSTRRPVAGS